MLKDFLRITAIMVSIFVLCITMRCNPDEDHNNGKGPSGGPDPLDPKPAITTTVSGVVIDENGQPVADAEVKVHGETATTGQDGTFHFPNIQVPGNRCVVLSRKDGYFSGIRALTPEENGKTETRIVLMGSPVTHTFEASTGSNAALTNGSEVSIPAEGLVDKSGNLYTGQVNMSVRYMDPTAGNFGVLVPGGDMVARREDQSTSILYSYGILRVHMTDLNGENLQLAPGSTATLIMSIPADQLSTAPDKIPLWYFDEDSGVWQEEGFAVREDNRYVGTVKHFTDWNCDAPTEGATIIGRLVDCNNNPAYGVVEFGQTASDPQSSTVTGEHDGKFERRVPDGVEIAVVISDPLLISPLTQNERGKVIVIVPPLSPGQVYDVGDIQTFPCPATVKASFKTDADDQVFFVGFETQIGVNYISEPGENLSLNLPANLAVTITSYTKNGMTWTKNIQTPAENETLDLGLIDLSASRNEGEVQIKGKTLCFGEVENEGQISVYWNDGNLNTGTNYTTPEADGTFVIQAPANMSVEVSSSTPNGTWKKTVQTPATSGAVVDLGTTEICENAQVGETSFRISGDGFDNALINLVSNEDVALTNIGTYSPADNITYCGINDIEDEIYLGLMFPGNSTGVRNQVDEVFITIERKVAGTTVYYWGGLTAENTDVTLNITKYEDVGGVIEGSFSGTFLVQDINKAFTGNTVSITEGKFSVVRYQDLD